MLIQQGDVLFFRIDEMPNGGTLVQQRNGRHIFAEGEATGHHHSCEADIGTLTRLDDSLFFSCDEEVVVTHQEHGPVTLDPGAYRIEIIREVDPFSDEIRRVMD